jgi:DNA-binding NarL/FixJ family response regulator
MPFAELGRGMRALSSTALDSGDIGIDKAVLEKLKRESSAFAKQVVIIDRAFRSKDSKERADGAAVEELSKRELDVLKGFYQGLTNEEIAMESEISVNNVKSVAKRIYNKLGAANKADAIRIALENGIV